MNVGKLAGIVVAAILLTAGAAGADVFNMGPGLTSLEVVPVGDPGNRSDTKSPFWDNGPGKVRYTYSIGKYEVTAGQYCQFLNAVAKTDTYHLYNSAMRGGNIFACRITQHGVSGSYTYDFSGRPSGTEADWANRPVNWVTYWDACRFANWLENGQPTGAQDASTTERGAYTLDGYNGNNGYNIQRNAGTRWALPTDDEWYKAAYYKGGNLNAGYWTFPTQSDTAPGQDMADVSENNANYYTSPYTYPLDNGKYTTLVGEFQNSSGAYGTFDQGGNLAEWDEGLRPSYGDGSRHLRGGSFYIDHGVDFLSSDGPWGSVMPNVSDLTFGFRVVQLPEPGAGVLACLSGLAILKKRRRAMGS